MKFSKILLAAALLTASFALASCADDDDPNSMISGSNNNYAIDFTNDTAEVSRGYNSTNLKHSGALVKISFEKASTDSQTGEGVMGMIFDLKDSESGTGKDFAVIGFQNKQEPAYYVSYYKNITDLQANNFGATLSATEGPTETSIVNGSGGFSNVPNNTADTADGGLTFYVYFALFNTATNVSGPASYKYNVYVLPKSVVDTVKEINGTTGKLVDSNNSDISIDSYKVATINDVSYDRFEQNRFAVYANVYAGKTVKGTWQIIDDFKAADVVAD